MLEHQKFLFRLVGVSESSLFTVYHWTDTRLPPVYRGEIEVSRNLLGGDTGFKSSKEKAFH